MFGAAAQPETGIEVSGANNGAREAHARLNDDPSLLRVGLHRSALAGGSQPTVPCLPALERLVAKVIGERNADAGVPEVLGNEPMSAPGTFQSGRIPGMAAEGSRIS